VEEIKTGSQVKMSVNHLVVEKVFFFLKYRQTWSTIPPISTK
jgi:hypothetical protein